MKELIKSILSEDNGNFSSMRIIVYFIVGVVLINWTYANIKTGQIVTLDWQEIAMVVGPLLAKAYQKGHEEKK